MFKRKKTAGAQAEAASIFVLTAKKYIGYQAGLMQRNAFGERVGYDSTVWSGAFIDVVARESGLHLPSFVYTPAAIAEAVRNGLVVSRPAPGDIVVYNFATDSAAQGVSASAFGMPHCGIVTDVRELSTNGAFQVVEANTRSGHPKYEAQQRDGVYLRVRRLTDVMMFIRPQEFQGPSPVQLLLKLFKMVKAEKLELDAIQEAATNPMLVSIQYLEPGKRNKHIEVVQLALSLRVDIQGARRGYWDEATRTAFARYQRNIGRVGDDASGEPDFHTLQRLGQETGVFKI
jgi:hypothetical protein